MTQPLPAKAAAICTLLPFLHDHLSLLAGAQITQRYGDSTPEPGPPSPAWVTLDCDGRCRACEHERVCLGEGWERLERFWKRYRMDAIRRAYRDLEDQRAYLHRAVRLVYVEPWDADYVSPEAKIMRQRMADGGVEWMAGEIRGEIVGLGEHKVTAEQQVERLVNEGITSPTTLAQRVGCTVRHAKRLKHAVLARSQSTVSAGG